MSKDKFLIVKNEGGLGNRILSALGSILYAQITRRKVIIDWRDSIYSRDRSNVFPKIFTTPNLNIRLVEEIPYTGSVYPPIWTNNLDKSVLEFLRSHNVSWPLDRGPLTWSKYRVDTRRIDYPYDCLVSWYYSEELQKLRRHFKGEFANFNNWSNDAILRKLLKENLILNESIQSRVDEFKNNSFGDKTIGLHIRYTDRKSPFEKYLPIINKILQKEPKALIFIATDNRLVESYFREKYKNIVISTEKWYPANQTSIYGSPETHLHGKPDCPDLLENCIEALIDMYLLASCDYLLCDQTSTLARVARLISDISEAQVIDISKYSMKRVLKGAVGLIDRYV